MAGTKLAPDLTAADHSDQPDLTTSESNGLPTDSPLLRSIPLEAIPPVSGGKLFLQPLLNLHEIKALEELYRKLPDYFSADEKLSVLRAYLVASDAHREQTRMTGEPYILHPIDVTNILADLHLDADTLAAGCCTTWSRTPSTQSTI